MVPEEDRCPLRVRSSSPVPPAPGRRPCPPLDRLSETPAACRAFLHVMRPSGGKLGWAGGPNRTLTDKTNKRVYDVYSCRAEDVGSRGGRGKKMARRVVGVGSARPAAIIVAQNDWIALRGSRQTSTRAIAWSVGSDSSIEGVVFASTAGWKYRTITVQGAYKVELRRRREVLLLTALLSCTATLYCLNYTGIRCSSRAFNNVSSTCASTAHAQ